MSFIRHGTKGIGGGGKALACRLLERKGVWLFFLWAERHEVKSLCSRCLLGFRGLIKGGLLGACGVKGTAFSVSGASNTIKGVRGGSDQEKVERNISESIDESGVTLSAPVIFIGIGN